MTYKAIFAFYFFILASYSWGADVILVCEDMTLKETVIGEQVKEPLTLGDSGFVKVKKSEIIVKGMTQIFNGDYERSDQDSDNKYSGILPTDCKFCYAAHSISINRYSGKFYAHTNDLRWRIEGICRPAATPLF